MTCDDALAAMLDAELADLRPEHPAPLGLHLATCARCRRVASQLREDAAQLAAMVAVPRVVVSRAPLRVMPWMAGAVAVAGLALVLRTPSEPGSVTAPPPQPGIAAAVEVPVPVVASEPTPPTPRAVTSVRHADLSEGNKPVRELVGVSPDPVIAVAISPPPATMAVAFESPTAVSPASIYATPTYAVVATTPPQAKTPPPSSPDVTLVPSRLPGVTALWFN